MKAEHRYATQQHLLLQFCMPYRYKMRTESATVTGDMRRAHSLVSKSALLTALHCEMLLVTLDTDA